MNEKCSSWIHHPTTSVPTGPYEPSSLVGPDLDRSHIRLDEFEAVAAVNAVFMYALMRAHAETVVRTSGTVKRNLRLAAAVRPVPHLTALRKHYRTAEFDLHFDYGLNALLDGIVRRVGASS